VEPRIEYTETSDGVRIAWTATGSGPTLVALPGVPFGDFAAEWRIPVLRRAYLGLTGTVRLVQFDTRGSGHSQRDVPDLSFDATLRDLDAVLEAAGVDRCVLLGFYHSCLHAVAYAARHPERVRGLVLFGGSLRGWDAMRGPGTQALLSLIDRDWDTFVESIAHAWLGWPAGEDGRLAADWFRNATTPEVARRVFRDASAIDVTADAAVVAVDALVLHRRDAPVIPLDVSEALTTALPKGTLRVLDGASASLFFERMEETIGVLRDATTGVVAGGRPGSPSGSRSTRSSGPAGDALTQRELEVLRLIAAGSSNGEIAATLGLSINTVERHVGNIYRKIDARGRADATAYAIRRGLA